MISSIIDMVLLAALAATSGSVLMMYRRLQRFDALQGQAAREFARSSEALDRARDALVKLQADGGEVTVTLAARLNEARMLMNDIGEAASRANAAFAAGEAAAEAAAETQAAMAVEPRAAQEPVPAPRRGPRTRSPSAAGGAHHAMTTGDADDGAIATVRAAALPGEATAAEGGPPAADAASLAIGRPSAVDRIRAAARANGLEPASHDGARREEAKTETEAAEAASTQTAATARDHGHAGADGDGPAHQQRAAAASSGTTPPGTRRWTPPRTKRGWSTPGQQPPVGRWAAAAAAEGRLQQTVVAGAVDWRDVAREPLRTA